MGDEGLFDLLLAVELPSCIAGHVEGLGCELWVPSRTLNREEHFVEEA